MNVFSVFDGMSCGQIALNKGGVKYDNYFASEIDKYAIKVTQSNFPNTIQLGDIRDINPDQMPIIHLFIGGSPCQSFSFSGKRAGMSTKCNIKITTLDQYIDLKNQGFQFEGQSYLFWEFVRILQGLKKKNKEIKFLLENVVMSKKWESIISKSLDIAPILIDSSLVSAQNRKRLYWTNIGAKQDGLFGYLATSIKQPKDKGILLDHILEKSVSEKYFITKKGVDYVSNETRLKKKYTAIGGEKSLTLMARYVNKNGTFCIDANGRTSESKTGSIDASYAKGLENFGSRPFIKESDNLRRLTPVEFERLQTVPDNYTNFVSDTQRYRMIGNGWTVDVIEHIFSYL